MEEVRVQVLNGVRSLEVTSSPDVAVPEKETYTEAQLLSQKAYFEEMVRKGREGLESVEERLTLIADETPSIKV